MDTKKLRQKILDLAIHGKLVPQDPNDEPASVLLERIRAEKERLIAEGKIKRSKKSATSDTSHYENVPFDVPEGWCWCHLDELFLFIRNGKSIKQIKGAGGFPITRIETISNSVIDRERMGYANITDTKGLEEYILRNGDILMSHINSPIHVGKSALCCDISEDEIILHGMNLLCLRPHSGIDSFYLDMYFNSPIFRDLIRPYIKNAVNQASINTQNIGNTYIPVPPLAEQIRISNMYKSVNTYLTDLTLSLEGLTYSISSAKSKILDLAIHGKLVPQDTNDEPASELLKRINPKAITSCDNPHYENIPFVIPSNWVWVKLGDVTNYGKCSTCSVDDIGNDRWILELEDIEKDTGKVLVRHTKAERDIKGVRHAFSTGNVLYSKLRTYLNKVLLAKDDGFCTTEIIPIECTGVICPKYLCYVLRSQYFLDYTAQCGYGVKMPRLSTNDARKAMIPLPPLPEQFKIIEKVEAITQGVESIARAL